MSEPFKIASQAKISKTVRVGFALALLTLVPACGKKGDVKPPSQASAEISVSAPFFATSFTFLTG